MTNQNNNVVVVVNVEEGISNEEADTRHDDVTADQPPSSAIPWWKQKRTIIILSVVTIIVVAVAIALGVSLSKSNNNNPVDEIGLVSPSSSPISNSSSLTARPPVDASSSTISNSELKNLSMTIYGISSIEDTNSWSEITALDIECYFNGCGVGEEEDVNKDDVWDVSIDLVVVDVVSSDDKVDVDRTSLPWLITDESDKGSEEEGKRYLQQEDPQTQYVQVIYNQLSNYTTSNPTMYDDLYVATDPYAQSVSQDAYIARLQSLSNFYDDITSIGSVVRQIPSDDEDDSSVSLAPSASPLIISLTSPPLPDITSSPPSMSVQSAPSTSSPTTQYKCFGADDGNYKGILYNAVRAYVTQSCANNQECTIAQTYGWPMNSWCVGSVTDMSYLFQSMDTFNEDINGWNTSSVTAMSQMFYEASSFNGDLNFDTSKVTDMVFMFNDATVFDGDVSSFDTSSVTDMYGMFGYARSFSGRGVSNFDTSSVTSMRYMFKGATSFNQDLCAWQDSFPYNTADTFAIFLDSGCTYQDTPQEDQNGPFCASDCQSLHVAPPITVVSTPSTSPKCFGADDGSCMVEEWDGSCNQHGILGTAVRSYISQDCANNKDCLIGQTYGWPMNSWCVGSVKDMSSLFQDMATFNEDINGWNTSSVTKMWSMFKGASSFNGDLSNFNTSSVTNMEYMFYQARSFNRDLSNFVTSSILDMSYMFWEATSFNQDLCAWQDSFPYTAYIDETVSCSGSCNIFRYSGCTYKTSPQEGQKGPFCASDCQSSQVSTNSTSLPASDSQQQEEEECIDTPAYLDMYNGGCDLYALPANEAWCGAYGNDGEVGMTPNENCCVCK